MKTNPKPIAQVYWENFERFRKERGLTMYETEKNFGWPRGTIGNAKMNLTLPKSNRLEDIAEYFSEPYIEFFTDWDE